MTLCKDLIIRKEQPMNTLCEINPGDVIVRPDGRLDICTGIVHYSSEPDRLMGYRAPGSWVVANCELAQLHHLRPYIPCGEPMLPSAEPFGFIVNCECSTPWGRGFSVKTPCCQRGRLGRRHMEQVTCLGCGWLWVPYITEDGAITRWISLGPGA